MSAADFFEWLPEQASPWARGEIGENWWLFWGHLQDGFTEAAKEAVRARFPSLAAPDALQAQAADRNTERYLGEAEASFRVRLAETFDRYQALGTPAGLVAAAEVVPGVLSVDYLESWQIEPSSPLWARWWVLCRVEWPLAPAFDAPGLVWDGGWTWDFGAVEEQALLLRQLRRYRAAHCKGRLCVATPDAPVFDAPGFVWDGGWLWDGGKAVMVEV